MTGRRVVRLLRQLGCEVVRQRGSHVRVRCDDCETTVPVHAGADLPPGTCARSSVIWNRASGGSGCNDLQGCDRAGRNRSVAGAGSFDIRLPHVRANTGASEAPDPGDAGALGRRCGEGRTFVRRPHPHSDPEGGSSRSRRPRSEPEGQAGGIRHPASCGPGLDSEGRAFASGCCGSAGHLAPASAATDHLPSREPPR
jgi:predicted RNA binding protein YcfA (HicA-like mRNA interferase family)